MKHTVVKDGRDTGQRRITHKGYRSRSLMPGVDGRSREARYVRDCFGGLCSDQGGIEKLGQARRDLTLAFAVSAAVVRLAAEEYANGKGLDLETFNRCVSNMARVASLVGIDPKVVDLTPSVADLVAGKGTAA